MSVKMNTCRTHPGLWSVLTSEHVSVCVTWSQGESELVAKDDNLDAADPNKDKKTEDKDQQMDSEEKEKINEQGDQVTFITHTRYTLLFSLHEKPHCHHHKVPLQFLSWWRTSDFKRSSVAF